MYQAGKNLISRRNDERARYILLTGNSKFDIPCVLVWLAICWQSSCLNLRTLSYLSLSLLNPQVYTTFLTKKSHSTFILRWDLKWCTKPCSLFLNPGEIFLKSLEVYGVDRMCLVSMYNKICWRTKKFQVHQFYIPAMYYRRVQSYYVPRYQVSKLPDTFWFLTFWARKICGGGQTEEFRTFHSPVVLTTTKRIIRWEIISRKLCPAQLETADPLLLYIFASLLPEPDLSIGLEEMKKLGGRVPVGHDQSNESED